MELEVLVGRRNSRNCVQFEVVTYFETIFSVLQVRCDEKPLNTNALPCDKPEKKSQSQGWHDKAEEPADKKEVFEDYKKGHLPIVDIVQLPLSKKMSSCLNQLERLTSEL